MFTGVSEMLAASIIRAMKAASISGTSLNFYHTTRRNNLEDSHLHKNLSFGINLFIFIKSLDGLIFLFLFMFK
jgi:hypothetical protein